MVIKILKSGVISFAAGLILMLAPSAALAWSNNNNGNDNEHNKITICHATDDHGYVMITPNANGNVDGHSRHADDIIPPFDYNDHGTTKHFVGLNWDTQGQAIYNNGCVVPGGHGGGCDQDNGRDDDCTPPQKDCDSDFDNSSESECTPPQPQMDCDSDFDNSPASECATGGQGGGPTGGTTTTTTGQVLGATTTSGGAGAAQVAVVPEGSVNGGEGAASRTFSHASMFGLVGSLVTVGSGLALLNRRQN
jgi:hypothetical protein